MCWQALALPVKVSRSEVRAASLSQEKLYLYSMNAKMIDTLQIAFAHDLVQSMGDKASVHRCVCMCARVRMCAHVCVCHTECAGPLAHIHGLFCLYVFVFCILNNNIHHVPSTLEAMFKVRYRGTQNTVW